MHSFILLHRCRHSMPGMAGFVMLSILSLGLLTITPAFAQMELDRGGFLDFSYGIVVKAEPTAETPESKLWWNDGSWWGSLYYENQNGTGEYRIHRLNMETQTWEETGVVLDNREESRADVLWAPSNNKLYVASHIKKGRPRAGKPPNESRLYRYSYDNTKTPAYSLDEGFPATVNQEKTETLVLDQDSTGRLWVTYVGRTGTDVDPVTGQMTPIVHVYINTSNDDGATWDPRFTIPFPEGVPDGVDLVDVDDIASLIAFDSKIGVVWSNQLNGHFYLATHDDSPDPKSGWTLETGFTDVMTYPADDHINLAKTATGQLLAVIKTSVTMPSDPLIGVVARDTDGTFSFHPVSSHSSRDTRPIVLYDEADGEMMEGKAVVFLTSKTGGGQICMVTASIPSPLSALNFQVDNNVDNCPTVDPLNPTMDPVGHRIVLGDSTIYNKIDNVTSTKQAVNATSGMVIVASDDTFEQALGGLLIEQRKVYVHNALP